MKTLFVILSFLLSAYPLNAQEFAPIGAEWYYCEGSAFAPEGYESYLKVRSTKDTLIQNKQCKELQCDWLCWHPHGTQYVYSSGDSVFLFDPLLDDFKLIYDFSAILGDTIKIPIKDSDGVVDTVALTIDSVGSILINSILLKRQYVTYHVFDSVQGGNQNFSYTSEIIETIGDIYFAFNFPERASQVCDANYSCGLRCYDDILIGHYETGIAPDCDFMSVSVKEPQVNSLDIHPNPTSNFILIESVIESPYSIFIYDLNGKIVRRSESVKKISLDALPNGFYYLNIIDNQNNFYLEKVIKSGS